MKLNYLVIAFSFVFICIFNDFKIRVIVALVVAITYRFYCGKERLAYRFALVILLVVSIPLNVNRFTTGYVESIKDSYYTVSNGLYKVIVYSDDENITYDCKVSINSEIKQINTYNNFELTDFLTYCKGNNILGYVDSAEIIETNFSLRTLWYQHNKSIGNYWANRLIFSRGLDSESSNIYLITQSGMHISFVLLMIRKILNRHMYKRTSLKVCVLISFIYGLFMRFPYSCLRVFISLLMELITDDKRKRLALEMMSLCLLKPYYVLSLPFLAVEGIKTINIFSNKRSKVMNMFYMVFLQLLFYHKCDLVQVFLFTFIRIISSYLFVLSLLVHFPLKLNGFVLSYVELIDSLSLLEIKGRINVLFFIFILKFIYWWLKTGYKKYLIYLGIILILINNYAYLRCYHTVTFLDIGQGDCCLITFPNESKGLLIDTGGNNYKDVSTDITIPYLESMGINEVDVIVTHEDYDHCGGLDSLIDNFNVNDIYREKERLIEICNTEVFDPLYDKKYDNENDDSLLSYLKLKQFCFLFLADISSTAEQDLVNEYGNLRVDVVKLSHHGSKTATSDKLLSKYQFKLAIISAGRNNRYSHPSEEVLERLNAYHIAYLSTKEDHAIKFYVFNHLLIYVTSDAHWGFYIK